jgi:hypothetical protein
VKREEFDAVGWFVEDRTRRGESPPLMEVALGLATDGDLGEAFSEFVVLTRDFMRELSDDGVVAAEYGSSTPDARGRGRKLTERCLRSLAADLTNRGADNSGVILTVTTGGERVTGTVEIRTIADHFGSMRVAFNSGHRVPDDLAQWCQDMLLPAAGRLRCSTAYVTWDRNTRGQSFSSPYEIWVGLPPHLVVPECARVVRGYYWANLLGPKHLELLGCDESFAAQVA